jgi:ABC-type multidrug transport system fused ATPase/permease subunit
MVCPERIQQYIEVDVEGTEHQKKLFQGIDDEATETGTVGTGSRGGDSSGGGEKVKSSDSSSSAPTGWPSQGAIKFDDVLFRYQPGGDIVLNNLSFR